MQCIECKENCKTLNISCTCFNLFIMVKVKENVKCFFRKDLTSFFHVTSYISFAYSLLVNCDVSRLELVKNMMQIMHITLIFMCKYQVAGALQKAELHSHSGAWLRKFEVTGVAKTDILR